LHGGDGGNLVGNERINLMAKEKVTKAERQMRRRNCLTAIVLLGVVAAFAVSVFVVRLNKSGTPLPANDSSWQGAVQQMMEGEGTPVAPAPAAADAPVATPAPEAPPAQ
jgi:hypothetical protein